MGYRLVGKYVIPISGSSATLKNMYREQRRRHLVDRKVQGALLRQGIWYWVLAIAVYMFVVAMFRITPLWFAKQAVTPSVIWYHVSPMVIASAALLPFVIYSSIRFSHRFSGPMLRFREVIGRLTRREEVAPIALRRTDFWRDVAEEINLLAASMQQSSATEEAVAADCPDEQDEPVCVP